MYRRSIKRYAWGDYYNQETGVLEGNRITGAASYGNLVGGAIDAVDPGNEYGVRSSAGAGLSGLAKGAAAGAAFGPWGAAIGGAIGGITGLINNKKAKEAEEAARKAEKEAKMSAIMNHSKGVLSTYPTEGITETLTAAYGMKIPKFPAGGRLPYPTDGSGVEQLASDVAIYKGDTHEQGGIELDTNQDGQPEIEIENKEVIKDDFVLSNRLYPSKEIQAGFKKGFGIKDSNITYAELAEKLAKKKGKFEEKLNSTRLGEAGTAKLMTERYDKAINVLFEDQQMNKNKSNIGEYAYGGGFTTDPTPKKTAKPREGEAGKGYDEVLTKNRKALEEAGALTVYDISRGDFDEFNNNTSGKLVDMDAIARKEAIRRFGADNNLYQTSIGALNPISSQTTAKELAARKMYGLENNNESAVFSGADIYTEPVTRSAKFAAIKPEVKIQEEPRRSTTNTFPGVYFKAGGYFPIEIGRKKGYGLGNDFMPKYALGDPIMKYDEFGRPIEEVREDGFAGVEGSSKTPFSERIDDNLGNIATGIGFFANQAQINNLETEYKPEFAKAPNYNFTSRLPHLNNQIRAAYRTASDGLKGSSAQDNQALKANLFAKTLGTLNQASTDEFAREDAFKARHNENVQRVGIFNTQVGNHARYSSMDNRNERRGLTQQNIDSLLKGVIGNKAMSDARDLDFVKNYMELLKGDETGVSGRLLDKLPARIKRRYIGNYYNH